MKQLVCSVALLLALATSAQNPAPAAAEPPEVKGEIERAQSFLANGDPNAGIYLLRQTLEKRKAPRAAKLIAKYYEGVGDYRQAIDYLKAALALAPTDTIAHLDLARLLAWTGAHKAAIVEYQKVLAYNPKYEEALLGVARAQSWAKYFNDSIANYRKVVEINPTRMDARIELGRVLGWAGKLDLGAKELLAVLRMDPRNADAQLGLAHIRAWQGKLPEAVRGFDAVLTLRPRFPEAVIGKAQVQMWLGQLSDAKRTLATLNRKDADSGDAVTVRKAIAKAEADRTLRPSTAAAEPSSSQPKLGQSTVAQVSPLQQDLAAAQKLAWAAKYDDSQAAYEKILASDPDNTEALAGLARAYEWSRHFAQAVEIDRRLLAKDPQNIALKLDIAKLLAWSAKFDESSRAYEEVLKLDPDSLEAALGLARVAAWASQFDVAVQRFQEVSAKHPQNLDADLGIGQVWLWKGDLEQARASLETLRTKYPSNTDVEAFAKSLDELEKTRAAQALVADAAPVTAAADLAALNAKLASDPNDADALRRLGDSYQAGSKLPEAIALYERLVKLSVATDKDRLSLAKYYSWNKQLAQAVPIYQAYLAGHADDDATRLELARVLSWTGRNSESEAEYQKLLEKGSSKEIRLGYARVLSWDKKYPESLKHYAVLREQFPKEREIAMEQARVTAWNGKFPQALTLFDAILADTPTDREALLAKAQVLTWSGRAAEAEKILQPLAQEAAKKPDVGVTWASVQQSLGRPDLALATLDQLNAIDPANREVRGMREEIHGAMRPELSFNFWSGLDSSEMHVFVTKATYSFNTGPRVRSFVSFSVIPSSAPNAGTPKAQEAEYGLSFRANRYLQLRADSGLAHMSSSTNDFIGGAGFTVFAHPKLSFDFDLQRRVMNVIPTAVPYDVARWGPAVAVHLRPDSRTNLDLNGFHYEFTDTNAQNGVGASIMRRLLGGEAHSISLGYLFSFSGFTAEVPSGFFTPRRLVRHAAQLAYNKNFGRKLHYSFFGTLGKESYWLSTTPPSQLGFHRDGTVTSGLSYDVSPKSSFGVSYSYLNLAIPGGSSGAYRTNAISAFSRFRF
jgi:tetratricopeptide (TPR) repeat protein